MDITVRIAGTEYKLKVETPESEQFTRMAVDDVNAMLAKYDNKYMDRALSDKLVFVSLFEAKAKLQYASRLKELASEIDQLKREISDYIVGVEKK